MSTELVEKVWDDFVASLPQDIDPTTLAMKLAAEGLGYFVIVHDADVAARVALDLIERLQEAT